MRKSSRTVIATAMVLALAGSSACTSPEKRTAEGAAAGGAGGAILGGAFGGGKGAAIGAGVGIIAGGAVGNYLDKQAKELRQVAETKRTEEGVLVKLKNDLLFDTGKAELKPDAQQQLAQLGDILTKYPADRIRVEGFTDSTGSESFNQSLSERRANSVKDALASRGVKPEQLLVSGRGEQQPIASNANSVGRSKNRRVELHIDVPPENRKS